MDDEAEELLIDAARRAREEAYAPYSHFRVGAAVMSEDRRIHVGCNVENASYGATLCAERAAIAAMVAAGQRRAIAVAIFVDESEPAMPCGICRQVIAELGQGAQIITATSKARKRAALEQLLPDAFVLHRDG